MARYLLRRLFVGFFLALPVSVFAQGRTLPINIGTSLNVEQILTNIINYMGYAIIFVAGTMFTIGAFMIVASRGESDMLTRGKKMVIGAIIGMAVVLGAFAILRTVFFFIYA